MLLRDARGRLCHSRRHFLQLVVANVVALLAVAVAVAARQAGTNPAVLHDGLALSLKDVGSARHYLDIHSAIKASPTPEVTK